MTLILAGFTGIISSQINAPHPLENVITAYLEVKNELTKDNSSAIRRTANNFYEVISQVPKDKLSVKEQKTWIEYEQELKRDADQLRGTDDIAYQRELFSKVSVNLYNMLLVLNINSSELYYQFCPMAGNGKGAYWLSEQENILNPYFGRRMLTCGRTVETIYSNQ